MYSSVSFVLGLRSMKVGLSSRRLVVVSHTKIPFVLGYFLSTSIFVRTCA
ncbi:hypothetical protein RSAG8_01284, partial [Rhizoctonia solani AG-8 WAC10335]